MSDNFGRRLVQVYADDLEQAKESIRSSLALGIDPPSLQRALEMLSVDEPTGGDASEKEPSPTVEPFLEAREMASITHEANRRLAFIGGDKSHERWDRAPEWQRDSAEAGVRFHLDNPSATPADSHESWLAQKQADGWVFGSVKDPDASPPTHPCIVPYSELPPEQQAKDYLFRAIVHGLAPFVMGSAS